MPNITLIVPVDVRPGVLRSLAPWVHDHITTPVPREIAAKRIKNVFRMRLLEQETRRGGNAMRGWLRSMEEGMQTFDPLLHAGTRSSEEIGRAVLRNAASEGGIPSYLLIALPSASGALTCDLFRLSRGGLAPVASGLAMSESALFLCIRSDHGLAAWNLPQRPQEGARTPVPPPEILREIGALRNLAGSYHAGRYILGLNYDRRVRLSDALELRGLSLPGAFLGSVSENVRNVSDSFLVLAHGLALAADSQSDNGAHVIRLDRYATILAGTLGLPERSIRTIGYSARLHDVGKIYIHPDLLEKPIRLTQREFDLIKRHPVLGVRILGDSPLLETARKIALTHHECWDGSGYPQGLSGSAIPIEGAIVKIADIYDALRTMHAYKSSCSHEDACQLILAGGGDGFHETRPSHFHPDVLRAFRQVAGRFDEIYAMN